jgi:hypothetical protein
MKDCPIAATVSGTDGVERLRDLLDGKLSSKELAEISEDPVLRSLAIRIYGDAVRDVLGEETIIDDISEKEEHMVEVVTVEVTDSLPVVPMTPTSPLPQAEINNNRGLLFLTIGIFIVAFDLFNVFVGLGSVIGTCKDLGCTATRLKLNLLSAHQMSTPIGWSEVGLFGIPDYLLMALGIFFCVIGIRKMK